MPNFREYHESVTSELDAVKNRVRDLLTTPEPHWLTDGEWKEAALKSVLRRHLPAAATVGRGFIVGPDHSSTQIDLLVLKPEKPTLFRDGELVIVTPDVPSAIVEVKTSLGGPTAWYDEIRKLAKHGETCRGKDGQGPWLGMFIYDRNPSQTNTDNILNAVCRVYHDTGIAINCVTCGHDLFVRYWPLGEYEDENNRDEDSNREFWRAYHLTRLSPSYFIGNLVDAICNVDKKETSYAWFTYPGGKSVQRLAEKRGEECQPRS